ncbi:hypothetical protein JMJ56_09170 [Belnapia sp. T18]|uniref:Major facilitator superfamily (MFS) profile domain-containing protein n=1 Tax=Belnapia arida TaxID=2804533 RepID=A0ABS1U4E8_9PROT|nr:hypothetical protein [Belnapia arida]MBL6078176.1 hypothetical protein [Belnapia arida]
MRAAPRRGRTAREWRPSRLRADDAGRGRRHLNALYAHDYTTFLLAALGVGIAGGSFSVGVAYVSKWYPKERQGTAPSIFGAMMAPLANIHVWRFALYYFFVFGGFVALALWLPRFYVSVYGLDIVIVGMLGAAYSIPGSLFRVLSGTLSGRYGAAGDVVDLHWLHRLLLAAELPRHALRVARHPRPDRVRPCHRLPAIHGADHDARLLHEPGQGRGLQARPPFATPVASARCAAWSA